MTLDDIASEAKVTKGSFYWHYNSKDEVIHAACRHYYDEWHRAARAIVDPVPDPVIRLRKLVLASVKSCLIDEGNRVFTMEIITRSLHDERLRRGWRQFFDGVKAFYVALLEGAVALGRLDLKNPEESADLMLAAMEGYKLRAVFEPALCSRGAEKRIADQLLGLWGIPPE